MDIEISGRPSRMFRAEVEYAAIFFIQYIMPQKVWKELNIKIVLDSKMRKDLLGHCLSEDDTKKKRNFTVTIKGDMARHRVLKTLAHELVHVKQYATGELDYFYNIAMFNGKPHRLTNQLEDYLNYPWEIEAFGRDEGLYLIYRMLTRQEKIKFKRGKLYMGGKLMTKKRLLSLAKDAKIKM